MQFSEITKKIRIEANLTQDAFAALLGISRATVNRWEMGSQTPSPLALHILKEYCEKNDIPFDVDVR